MLPHRILPALPWGALIRAALRVAVSRRLTVRPSALQAAAGFTVLPRALHTARPRVPRVPTWDTRRHRIRAPACIPRPQTQTRVGACVRRPQTQTRVEACIRRRQTQAAVCIQRPLAPEAAPTRRLRAVCIRTPRPRAPAVCIRTARRAGSARAVALAARARAAERTVPRLPVRSLVTRHRLAVMKYTQRTAVWSVLALTARVRIFMTLTAVWIFTTGWTAIAAS